MQHRKRKSASRIFEINLTQVTAHPYLEQVSRLFQPELDSLLNTAIRAQCSSFALTTQIFWTTDEAGSERLVVGPLLAWLPIAHGLANVETVTCIDLQANDRVDVLASLYSEALLILATWPSSKAIELYAKQIIESLPFEIKSKALGLNGKAVSEIAQALKTSRHKLKASRINTKESSNSPLGFDLDALKNNAKASENGA